MIVLWYIRNISRRFKTFVANRLSIIQELSTADQWRHIDTKSNPADVTSRGIPAYDCKRMSMWLNGPDLLWKCASEWPNQIPVPSISKDDTEIKKAITINTTKIDPINDLMTYFFPDWNTLKRTVAWLIRFETYCMNRFSYGTKKKLGKEA